MNLSTGARLLKIRNPWGAELYHGHWSDDSELWTDDLRAEAGQTSDNDGIWFMSIEDFQVQFSRTVVNFDPTGWHHDYFLATNDDSQQENPQGTWDCGLHCTRHELTLESAADQEVYITAFMWDARSMSKSGECPAADTWNWSYLKVDNDL